MKSKVIFSIINMNVGGTEKALLNMISIMPREKYDLTIFMLEKTGGFLGSLPDYVHVEVIDGYSNIKEITNLPPRLIVIKYLKRGKIIKALNFLLLHLVTKVMKERSLFFRYLLRKTPLLQNEYDLAVAYAGPMDFISFFVAHKIKAKKKIQWIHFDIRKIGFNRRFAKKTYKHFDKIFVVSEEGSETLRNALPNFRSKIEAFPNITPTNLVVKMADKGLGFNDEFSGVRILTVGRLSKEKGQDITIPILARLKENEYNVRWYCIGEGNAREDYETMIGKYNLQNDYILIGSHTNPYPYMKHCDLYVQPSRHEGYCITLSEARCFDNPIVTTRFTGASEQISSEKTGLIVDFDEEQLYFAIKRVLDDEILRQTLKRNLQNEKFEENNSMEKLNKLIGESNKKVTTGETH